MTKLLNLDAIVPATKQVQIAGKKHNIVEMSVGLFAEIKRFESQDIEKMPITEQVASYASLVKRLVPTLTDKVMADLTVEQLQKIFMFALDMAEQTNEAAASEEAK